MAQRNNARIDRFAQMSKQEEIIAKKRQEILEKQRTAQLAKAVAAAQTLAAKMKAGTEDVVKSKEICDVSKDVKICATTPSADAPLIEPTPKEIAISSTEKSNDSLVKSKKDESSESATAKTLNSFTGKTGKISFGVKRLQPQVPVADLPPPKVVNSFCNDGSFLENFKKILEKHEPKPPQVVPAPESNADTSPSDKMAATQPIDTNATEKNKHAGASVQTLQNQNQVPQTSMVPSQHQAIPQPGMQQQIQQTIIPPMSQAPLQHHHHHLQPVPPPPQQQHGRSLHQPLQTLAPMQPQPQASLQPHGSQTNLQPPPTQPQFLFNHPPQPPPVPPPHPMSAAFFAAAPPPPPPPQLPMTLTLGPLYMIPAPEPLQLNTIPAPKEFDLNAIPNPRMNVEAIQMPHGVQQPHQQAIQAQQVHQSQQPQSQQSERILQIQSQQPPQQLQNTLGEHISPPPPPPQMQQQLQQQQPQQQPQQSPLPPQIHHAQLLPSHNQQLQQQEQQQLQQATPPPPPPPQQQQPIENQGSPPQMSDNNDHSCSRVQLPTTVEHLIDLVAENGDGYEDKIRAHKNDLHSTMWFLFEKNGEQYHTYRQQLNEHRYCQLHREQENAQQELQQSPSQQQEAEGEPLDRSDNHDSLEMDEESSESGGPHEHQQEARYLYHQQQRQQKQQQQQQQRHEQLSPQEMNQHDFADKYDPESAISGDVDSDDEYMRGMLDRNRDNLKRRIECRNELSEEERQEREAEEELEELRRQERKKQRKSRWGEKVEASTSAAGATASAVSNVPTSFANQNKPMLSAITRNDPALLQYARMNYGSTNLNEEDWKKCEEHYKVNLLYQDMMRKRQEIDRLARSGKFKYEYDSDEDVDGGTWEHKLRCAEMEATQLWATALTKQSEGKHHIGDFLPPEELKKFMEQYEAKKNNRQPDLSDYKEYKLKEDNIGFQMLQKLGWKEGQGLGTDGAGIVDPVNKAPQRDGNQGLGVASAATPEECDNEYDAYRKRMMLAYRFRPNPLNNPRRAYY
ncbi:PREDICTED: SURP and G-patch domain-containing protein 1 isoform X3 [Rhagoletis zephyria]|uniref:SURP and G-patch domain-containing protein 1 isoform X3 n=1 Tax=Rhagoletis zephyria TaxID=28612 RepID=UPI0008114F1F|nr:PREDICTED: SURP and G-patch domain-containing protein 1 isoform X3 [Rhagoletis zephyria]